MPYTERGGLLALDVATVAGICYGPRKPDSKVVPFLDERSLAVKGDGAYGEKLTKWDNLLEDLLALLQPSVIVIEAPLPHAAQKGEWQARTALGLIAIAHMQAYRHSVEGPYEVRVDDVRTSIFGHARLKAHQKADGWKPIIMNWCKGTGWPAPGHNAADAAALYLYASIHKLIKSE